MELKEIRLQNGLTQEEASKILKVSRKTYIKYENSKESVSDVKYQFLCETLSKHGIISETSGILTIESIIKICGEVFANYKVEFCYLFGSYAKGKATPTSDVDLLISLKSSGLEYFELIETLRENLKKRVDLLDANQLNNNLALCKEILKDGIKIYG